ncbi:hypothetical protein [Streptomyces sp. NPDC056672]|uniref:hypothetical protein n=1 Tax=Streptomyces sp. NPDC056672 TaxID=3345906 RepID=UPI0036AC3F0A
MRHQERDVTRTGTRDAAWDAARYGERKEIVVHVYDGVRMMDVAAPLEAGETVTGSARRSGLGGDESPRRVFPRHLGVTPSTYRARFRTTAGTR